MQGRSKSEFFFVNPIGNPIDDFVSLSVAGDGYFCTVIEFFDKDIVIEDFIFYYNNKDGDNTNSCIYLNSSEISLPLKIRSVKAGDKMQVKNLNGNKKISDIFIDEKVPKAKRSTYPIVVDAKNTVLWVPNLKKSQFSKDKSEKYDIIIRCKAR